MREEVSYGNTDVFKHQVYTIMMQTTQITSDALISRMQDYLWFCLKVVTVSSLSQDSNCFELRTVQ